MASVLNTDLTNAKCNSTLSGTTNTIIHYLVHKYDNTLYGTINTNRLNFFTLILILKFYP